MFVEEADQECLRQGDILAGIPFPLLRTDDMAIIGRPSLQKYESEVPRVEAATRVHRDDPNWLTAQVPVRLSFCAVISQCCDLEARHEKIPMPTFAVARLIPVPRRILEDPQRLVSLRENKDPRVRDDTGFINLFYVPSHERLEGKEWVVDFNQVASVPATEFPRIMQRKVLQMKDRWRVKFKIKLAVSLTRLTDDEIQAGLENPWQIVQ